MATIKRNRRSTATETHKRPFSIHVALERVKKAVKPYPAAAMFQLADEGYDTVFQQVVACLISIRTRDEVSLVAARHLLDIAGTPAAVSKLTPERIDALIHPSTFHTNKAYQIHKIARIIDDEHRGKLPCTEEALTALPGIGYKCANLVLGIVCGHPSISVDIHVHRVTNRWGIVHTENPDDTMLSLQEIVPKEWWIEINRRIMPFGKHICTGSLPHCSTCPVLDMCRQVGVTAHR